MSNIDTQNINQAYPTAGEDNDSQGFRDNYTLIVNALDTATTEITALEDTSLRTDVQNNMVAGSGIIKSAEMIDMRGNVVALTGLDNQAVVLDVQVAPYHKLTTTGAASAGSIILSFANFPTGTKHGAVYVEIDVQDVSHVLDIPGVSHASATGLPGYSNGVINYDETGIYLYKFDSIDAGATVFISEVTRSNYHYGTPATSFGAMGDTRGMILFDSAFIYTCVADYTTGSINIWLRTAITAGTW